MNKEDLRIVYMGTPDFAVEPLKRLIEDDFNVVGVITMPDKPAGRGHKIQFSPVKEYALSKNLPLLQPEKLKDTSFLDDLKKWNANLQIVVAFRMLPEVVWNMPEFGTFNLHASLLPQYRGAAPINWAIINGEKETGITTFFLTHEIDTGKIIQQEKISIGENDNVEKIHDQLMFLGGNLVINTVKSILDGSLKTKPQSEMYNSLDDLKPAPKIFKETCKIDLKLTCKEIHNFVRGLSPYPAAWCELVLPNGEKTIVKIYETEKIEKLHDLPCGKIVSDNKLTFDIAVKDGYIRIKSLQVPGKKRLNTEDFLRGYKIPENSLFI